MVYISLQTKPGTRGRIRLSMVIADSSAELRSFLKEVGVGTDHILSAGTYRERVELSQRYIQRAEKYLHTAGDYQFGVDQRDMWLKIHEREGTYQ